MLYNAWAYFWAVPIITEPALQIFAISLPFAVLSTCRSHITKAAMAANRHWALVLLCCLSYICCAAAQGRNAKLGTGWKFASVNELAVMQGMTWLKSSHPCVLSAFALLQKPQLW